MEDKKIVKLEDEQLEQIAGGSGDGVDNYTKCFAYQKAMSVLRNGGSVDMARGVASTECPLYEHMFDCSGCSIFIGLRR